MFRNLVAKLFSTKQFNLQNASYFVNLRKTSSTAHLCLFVVFILTITLKGTEGSPDAKRLYDDIISQYNKLVRPVMNESETVTVRIRLKLSQLIEVNLKDQIMTTNMWVEQYWHDYKLTWDPREYGGIKMLHVPSDTLWRPDIVLYNNAAGNFVVTLATKALIDSKGNILWKPPAIYKSSCEINVEYFPFDEQTCIMKFGSWSYDGFKVDLRHKDEVQGTSIVKLGIDLSEFYPSVEWDLMDVSAIRHEKFYFCCEGPFVDITFNITMRRKTLFYTVNLIIPCMGISFLTVLVFYLPSDSGEKVSLSVSILLALTVFFLLLAEIIPPTSLVVPLLGKYLLFTMILVTLSVCVTVVVLNVHFRSSSTHRMAPWVKRVFMHTLPRLLLMKRPNYVPGNQEIYPSNRTSFGQRVVVRTCNGTELRDFGTQFNGVSETPSPQHQRSSSPFQRRSSYEMAASFENQFPSPGSTSSCRVHGPRNFVGSTTLPTDNNLDEDNHHHSRAETPPGDIDESLPPPPPVRDNGLPSLLKRPMHDLEDHGLRRVPLSPIYLRAIDNVHYLADHTRRNIGDGEIKEDWKYVAMVLDRLFLWIFTIAVIVGTCGIILHSPSLYDKREPIDIKYSDIAHAMYGGKPAG